MNARPPVASTHAGAFAIRRLIAASLLVLLAACGRAAVPTDAPAGARRAALPPTAANQAASDYIDSVVGDELFEIQAADIAAARATAPAVRAYARRMAGDYAVSAGDLKRAISGSGQKLAAPTAMSGHLQSLLDELDDGTKGDFDKTYIDQQIEAQEETLGLISAYARAGAVPTIKAAASRLAPAVQAHLDQARSIEDALNKKL